MAADLSRLREPFDRSQIKQREGAGKRMLDYVQSADVIYRVIEATGNNYDWAVTRLEFVSDGKGAFWLCHGTLTIPGLGTRSGVGTAVPMNEDSVKSCETDAYKRAAVKFGVALDLYFKEGKAPGPSEADKRAALLKEWGERFKERAKNMGYTGKLTALCGAILKKDTVTAPDYGEALKCSAAEWNAAMNALAPQAEKQEAGK